MSEHAPHVAAAERFSLRAAQAGLAELAYSVRESPVGELLLVRSGGGLAMLNYLDGELDEKLDWLARRRSPQIVRAPALLDPWARELEEYFAGQRKRFEPFHWARSRFQRRPAASRIARRVASPGRRRAAQPSHLAPGQPGREDPIAISCRATVAAAPAASIPCGSSATEPTAPRPGRPPATPGRVEARRVAQVPLGVERRLTAGAGGGDRLAVGVVDEVARPRRRPGGWCASSGPSTMT